MLITGRYIHCVHTLCDPTVFTQNLNNNDNFPLKNVSLVSTVCPTRYRTWHFFNNFTTNEDIATKFEADLPHCVRNVMTS